VGGGRQACAGPAGRHPASVFGFHEVFHACTVAAFACQFAAVALIVRQAV
jgi:predicted membrane channel-forming protein YqfA (hemolysin III family)